MSALGTVGATVLRLVETHPLVSRMIARLTVHVQGSSAVLYKLDFWRSGEHVRALCTCDAGRKGTHCKHRLSILAGDYTAVCETDAGTLDALRDLVAASDIQRFLSEIAVAEKEAEEAKSRLQEVKAKLGWMMVSEGALTADIPGTAFKRGARGRVIGEQKGGTNRDGSSGTTLHSEALQLGFPGGGEIWVKPDEVLLLRD